MSDIEYEFKSSESGHLVWITLRAPITKQETQWAITHKEFAQFLDAASDASTDAAVKRIATTPPAAPFPPRPINNYYIASGGGGGKNMAAGGVVNGYGGGGETIESLERRRKMLEFANEQSGKPYQFGRKKKAHEIIAEERDRIFRKYGIK